MEKGAGLAIELSSVQCDIMHPAAACAVVFFFSKARRHELGHALRQICSLNLAGSTWTWVQGTGQLERQTQEGPHSGHHR